MQDEGMQKGHDITYNWVINLLQKCDLKVNAKKMGLQMCGEDKVLLEFFGRRYVISKEGVELKEEKLVWSVCKPKCENSREKEMSEEFEYNLKSVLAYYLLSGVEVEPQHDYCALSHFSSGIFSNSVFAGKTLQKAYGDDYGKFRAAAEKAGLVFKTEKSAGQYVWSYNMLPKVPVQLVYYEGDEEYPTSVQILYDKTAIKIFKFEQLAVLHSCFVHALAAIA